MLLGYMDFLFFVWCLYGVYMMSMLLMNIDFSLFYFCFDWYAQICVEMLLKSFHS